MSARGLRCALTATSLQGSSQYDAGWLHAFRSANEGELRRANWDDLNYPAQ
ncbi:MAG TPA: hypothetical protein VGE10_07140 [Zeimonas sp.]